MKPVYTNPHLEAVRKAFRASSAYQRMQGVVTPTVRALIGREPGSDDEPIDQKPISTNAENGQAISHVTQSSSPALGIPWDPLEVEMQNGGKP